MKKISLIVALCVIMLSACSNTVENRPIIEQQNLLQKCTSDTPIPTQFVLDSEGKRVYNGKELFRVLMEWQSVYNECAVTHNTLVDTINDLSHRTK